VSKLQERITKEMSVSAAKSAAYNASECLDRAILATPTGEARNALTIANIFLLHARDILAGRPTLVSLDDLAQQVADECYDSAMPHAATFRRIHGEGGVISLDEADTEQLRTT
jgi:hypothetical protein